MDQRRGSFNSKNKNVKPVIKLLRDTCVPLEICDSYVDEPPAVEDRRLINWRRWLSDRKRLEQRLGRRPQDLALNAHEKVRTKNEKRCLMQAAAKSEISNQNQYRGNPAFWKTAPTLGDKNEGIHVQMDRSARYLPPDLTRVALPEMIKQEKGLVDSYVKGPEIGYLTSKWECGDYLQRRTDQLKKELQFLQAEGPKMDELIVVGRKFGCGQKKEKLTRIPVISITQPETRRNILADPDHRIALKIQDREFVLENRHYYEKLTSQETLQLRASGDDVDAKKYAHCVFDPECVYKLLPKVASPICWPLNFQSDDGELCERRLFLENRGVQTITLDWRNVTPEFNAFKLAPNFVTQRFFFNKNRLSILPGQRAELNIWFRSENSSAATETWEILTEPKIYPGKLTFRLWAISIGKHRKPRKDKDSDIFISQLNRRVLYMELRQMIDDALQVAIGCKVFEDVPYELFFLEPDIFQVRNPTYFYNSVLVEELKTMHRDSTPEEEGKTWNLSLKDLRSNLRSIEDPNTRLSMLTRFQQLCDESLRRSYTYDRPTCNIKKIVYWLLCTFFNEFESESEFVINRCCTKIAHSYDEEETLEKDLDSETLITGQNLLVYREVFYVRIYCLLSDTVNRVCSAIDSYNYYNKEF